MTNNFMHFIRRTYWEMYFRFLSFYLSIINWNLNQMDQNIKNVIIAIINLVMIALFQNQMKLYNK